ncbi:MBL fold metallo-hydrolase [Tsukamurella sp. NPDC003166]|uniref:MBL fold metallo-hydrolase n=1 Tax=Tsukamurella sp. NPDC003166 TaxID=3154444 RepID=UPI0033BC3602
MGLSYDKGLTAVADGCHAWMQPDGSWGWSNSGLIQGAGTSLLVDTLFDLEHTREMIAGLEPVLAGHPIEILVNTHSDGDHYFGNEVVAAGGDVEIIASRAAAELMTQENVDSLAALTKADGLTGEFAREIFAPFTFEGITSTGPTRVFEGELTLDVGGRAVELIQVGPAHTPGDTLVHVPDAKVIYTGDIVFVGGTPIVWAGPAERWIAACDRILDMDVDIVVPGHGPVTDKSGVQGVRDYLTYIIDEATKRYHDGMTVDEAIGSIDLGRFSSLPEHGRLAQNVIRVYEALDPGFTGPDRTVVFAKIGELEGFGVVTGGAVR